MYDHNKATWVESIALTILALSSSDHTPEVEDRLAEAERYLTDRRCRGGGWNVGNPIMFSNPFPAPAEPAAGAILALLRFSPEAILPEDLPTLRYQADEEGGAGAVAWALLALRSAGADPGHLLDTLGTLQAADGSWNDNPYHTAVALMAMRGVL